MKLVRIPKGMVTHWKSFATEPEKFLTSHAMQKPEIGLGKGQTAAKVKLTGYFRFRSLQVPTNCAFLV